MDFMRNPPVVIDIGSGYTKMGLAGNIEPQFVLPTCVANSTKGAGGKVVGSQIPSGGLAETDFYIGDAAYQRRDAPNYLLSFPVSKGRIDNWDDMERFLLHAIFRNLRCFPEDHLFLLTEPPLNTPEARELTGEIMFETFNVKGLHLAAGAVLALYSTMHTKAVKQGQVPSLASADLTGLVVDSGDSLTQVIPVQDGFVISSCVQEIPIGGRHVTEFVSDMLRDRMEPVPPECRMEAAKMIKEQHAYLCRDVVQEYQKFDEDPRKFKSLAGVHQKTKEQWTISCGYERFLAPEIFFHPEIFESRVTKPLDAVVDDCIHKCPLDCRRTLYENIVLSGGSTTFLHFKERFQRDLQCIVDKRLKQYELASGKAPRPIAVQVEGGAKKTSRYSAWLGGSFIALEPQFESMCKMKREYDEVGPQCMRGIGLHS